MFQQALVKARDSQDKVRLVDTLTHLGDYYLQQGKKEQAKQVFQETLSLAEEQKIQKISDLFIWLAGCYRQTNRKEYYDYLDQFYLAYTKANE
jgi:tetratricopeptide (TPR) repeat protein